MDKYANVETTKFIRLENENKNTNSPTQIPIDTKRLLTFLLPKKTTLCISGMVLYLIIHPLAGTFLLYFFFSFLYVHIADLQTKKKLLLFNGHRRE
jgi:hypothetical protein